MSLHKHEGLVLRVRDLGEADKIVTLLTRERGKLEAVARGARRGRSRLLALAQPFTHGYYQLFLNKRSLHTLSQGEIIQPYRKLREDLLMMAYAAHFTEIVHVAVPVGENAETMFETILEALDLLEGGAVTPTLVSRWFEMRTLDILGYRPELDACVRCRHLFAAGRPQALMLSVAQGGLLCPSCVQLDPGAISINGALLQSMRFFLEVPAPRLSTFKMSAKDDASLEKLLMDILEYRLETRLEAWSFLQSIEGM